MKHLKIFVSSVLIFTLIATPMSAIAETPSHWAIPLVDVLQKDSLFKSMTFDSKSLEQYMTGSQFDSMVKEIADSKKLEITQTDSSKLKTLTRAKAAESLYTLFNANFKGPENKTSMTFKDVTSKDKVNTKALNWVAQTGLMKGYKDGTFKPNQNMKLGEGVALMNELRKALVANDLSSAIETPKTGITNELSYTWMPNADGLMSLVLSWGEKNTGGYSITVVRTELVGNELRVYCKLKSPGPDDMVTQAFTYPKVTHKTTYKKSETDTMKVVIYSVK